MRILIAEDDPVSRRLLEGTLTRLGHEVVAVGDGTAAVEQLMRADGPRLAILDWMMPGLDGLEVCRAVRTRVAPYVYVILLTARDRHSDLVEALDAEADDFLTKPFDAVELRARLRSGVRVLEVQERLLETQGALAFEASHDRLTGLFNRGRIVDHLRAELNRSARSGESLAVVMVDIDHFKRINDGHGHAAGDRVLRHAATRLRSVLRSYDAIGRYGGEEFLIVLPGTNADQAREVAERARVAVSEPLEDDPLPVTVTASAGVSWTGWAGRDADVLMQCADEALYRAKAAGRNRVEG
jgi:two-component system cell cycle response regulator